MNVHLRDLVKESTQHLWYLEKDSTQFLRDLVKDSTEHLQDLVKDSTQLEGGLFHFLMRLTKIMNYAHNPLPWLPRGLHRTKEQCSRNNVCQEIQ
jgi:hypothetical protein